MQIIYTQGLRNCLVFLLMKNKIKRFLIKHSIVSELTFRRMRKHWIRVVCDEEIHKFISNLNLKSLSTLEISGRRWQWLFPTEKYDNLNYPPPPQPPQPPPQLLPPLLPPLLHPLLHPPPKKAPPPPLPPLLAIRTILMTIPKTIRPTNTPSIERMTLFNMSSVIIENAVYL